MRVVDSGYEWNGVVYRSLPAVAHAVTGAHWNGKLFFGLTTRMLFARTLDLKF